MANKLGPIMFAVLTFAYLGLNSLLNFSIKLTLGPYGFRFPLLLTSCHMAFSFLVLAPFMAFESWDSHRAKISRQWKYLLCIGACLAMNIALNNMSLLDISLTLNQVIRCAIPVVTLTLAIIVEHKRPTRMEALSVCVLTIGVMLTAWQGVLSGKLYAILLCILSTVCTGLMMTCSGRASKRMDVLHLTFYTAPISLLCLAPFCALYEWTAFKVYFGNERHKAMVALLGTSTIALTYNVVHNKMIKSTSALATTVLGVIKVVGIVAASNLVLGDERSEMTTKVALGTTLTILGFAIYSRIKLKNYISTSDGPLATEESKTWKTWK